MPQILEARRPRNPKSMVDLTNVSRGSMQIGPLYPISFTDVVAGDRMTVRPDVMIQALPLESPIMGSLDVCLEMFFIPDRLYTDVLKQNNISTYDPTKVVFPTLNLPTLPARNLSTGTRVVFPDYLNTRLNQSSEPTVCEPNSLADFCGVPVGFTVPTDPSGSSVDAIRFINANRFLGYVDTIRNYYVNLQLNQCYTAASFIQTGNNSWSLSGIPLSYLDNVVKEARIFDFPSSYSPYKQGSLIFLRSMVPTLLETWLSKSMYDSGPGSVSVQVTDNEVLLTDVRFGSHVLQYMERALAGGTRYDDWLGAQFDVKVQRNLLIPQYLGSFRDVLTTDPVYQTSATQSDSAQGNLAGKAQSFRRGTTRTFRFEENGTFMCILSLRPRPDYFTGFDPMLFKTTLEDKYAPALDRMGFQSLPLSWVNALPSWVSGSNPSDTEPAAWSYANIWTAENNPNSVALGYQPAWSEYRTGYTRLHGELATRLRYWSWARVYSPILAGYNADRDVISPSSPADYSARSSSQLTSVGFVGSVAMNGNTYIFPWLYNFPFADTSPVAENFLYQVAIDIKCRREISKLNMPNFFI